MRVHLLGVGGIGMCALAGLLSARGFSVTGSEGAPPYPPSSTVLEKLGIHPRIGYRPEHIDELSPEAVVVGNAIRADNPEVRRAEAAGLPLRSLPSALAEWVLPGRRSLVVAGTHGKTTTAALLAHALENLGTEPTYLVGGLLRDRKLNFAWGNGPFAVLEGDEYDTAFFDRTPKFWHYHPYAAILTSVEYDHADIYPHYESLLTAFERFAGLVAAEGLFVFCADDPGAVRVAGRTPARRVSYGRDPESTYRLLKTRSLSEGTEVTYRGPGTTGTFFIPLWGEHNALNALAVWALLRELGFEDTRLREAFRRFPGVSRRQEVLYRGRVTVVDDFAHHPTAVRVTLSALREALRPRRILLCFEPRTNTSRRRLFQGAYAEVLAEADEVWLKKPPGLERIPSSERLDLEELARAVCKRGRGCRVVKEDPAEVLAATAEKGDLILFMSSASFGNTYENLIRRLKDKGL